MTVARFLTSARKNPVPVSEAVPSTTSRKTASSETALPGLLMLFVLTGLVLPAYASERAHQALHLRCGNDSVARLGLRPGCAVKARGVRWRSQEDVRPIADWPGPDVRPIAWRIE